MHNFCNAALRSLTLYRFLLRIATGPEFGTALHQKGGKDPHPQDFSLTKKTARFTKGRFVLTKDRKRPYYGHFCGKVHREGSCSKAAGGP